MYIFDDGSWQFSLASWKPLLPAFLCFHFSGKVFVDGKVVNKCGTPVSDKAVVEIKAEVPKYVCR